MTDKWSTRSTSIATCGVVAKKSDAFLGEMLELLFMQLGAPHPPTIALAYSEVRNIETTLTLATISCELP